MELLLRLDLQFFAGEKTEKATPKKRQDSRKKGQVLKSQDVTAAILLLMMFIGLFFIAPMMQERVLNIIREAMETYVLTEDLSIESTMKLYTTFLVEMAIIVVPIMAIGVFAGVAANLVQFGFLFTGHPLKPDLKKMDPIKGIKKIFSVRALVDLVKSLLKIALIGTATVVVIWMYLEDVLKLAFMDPQDTMSMIAMLTGIMGIVSALVLLFISVIDYFYQRYDYEKNLKMSKQDIKDEHKNVEGDPQVKGKIKQKQREMAMRRMMQEVPNADVVITNPTHYAIALKYDGDTMEAPRVVAKGTDFVAQKIKLIAKQHDVVMVENRPLARAMYDQVEIGDAVPEEFFKTVAEILAYVYRIKRKI
ncbi:flagellar biosynthesis protein FlhB [Caryophanon latum]|uniref:Flagellar biosynthetic protein FlhB n=1 Tax=Caryophanon latum TaxID=33977 RepID=A0A1C0YAT6_9BACL|nr:flagellar biosynthesis protein FlhB [Caryophanon latum]OCS84255.1 flagellar biosynthesis protein FlhB [Caryophanon latum]